MSTIDVLNGLVFSRTNTFVKIKMKWDYMRNIDLTHLK